MAKRISWFCADSAMPHDPRILSLPDNDYRWVFFCLLSLEKRGELDGQETKDFFHYCHCTMQKFPMILELLNEKGLLDYKFRPVDFDGWQQSMLKSQRNKRSRDSSRNTDKRVGSESQCSQVEPIVSLSETETETETKEEKKQESGKPSGWVDPYPSNTTIILMANKIILELNRITGKKYGRTTDIKSCIKREKCTVGECIEVLEYKWSQWAGTEMQKNVNPTTPFRAKHFQAYLDEARAGSGKSVSPKAQQFGKFGVAERNMEAMRQVNKELGYESEDNSSLDWGGLGVQRTDGARQDQGLLGWPSRAGRESGTGGTEGSNEGVQVFPEASGNSRDCAEDEEGRNGTKGAT